MSCRVAALRMLALVPNTATVAALGADASARIYRACICWHLALFLQPSPPPPHRHVPFLWIRRERISEGEE